MGISRRSFASRMLKLAIIVVFGLLATPALSDKRKLMDKIHKYNVLSRCWGEKEMHKFSMEIWEAMKYCGEAPTAMNPVALVGDNQLDALRNLLKNPAVAALLKQQTQSSPWDTLGRRKREDYEASEEDKMEFMEDIMDFKAGMMTKFSNLSCVLTQMKMLDAEGNINMELYSMKTLYPWLKDTPAGSDPVFLKKMVDSFSDCYDISRSWPQQSLDRNPVTKKHGRHMIFFECAKKMEYKLCTKFEVSQWIESIYGDLTKANLGLPGDKYDAAAVALMAMYSAATPEEIFVDDFFWQKSKM